MDRCTFTLLIIGIAAIAVTGCTTSLPATPVGTATPTLMTEQTTAAATVSADITASCSIDDDCVPAECCHPYSCMNRETKKPCNLLCAASCEGPLDCGGGRCGCVKGRCSVLPGSSGTGAPLPFTSIKLGASPTRYSPIMSSTPGIGLTPDITGFPPGSARFTWNTTYGQFLSWNAPDYKIHQLGNTLTNNGEMLYWSFTDKPASPPIPVSITVTAEDSTSGQVLGTSTVTLAWDDNYAVTVQNIE